MTREAVIRSYVHSDDENKLARFTVAKAAMEPLAIANFKSTTHPITIAAWILLSSMMVQMMGWSPKPEFGLIGYLRPVPAFGAMALPLVFLIDWRQRPTFSDQSVEILKRPDMVDILKYYSRSPSSGFWLLELGQTFVGLLALDASPDALSTAPVEAVTGKKLPKGTSTTAVIRHIYVAEAYRHVGAQNDLITFAIQHAFSKSSSVRKIRATPSPFASYLGDALRKAGFTVVDRGQKIGFVASRSTLTYELTRAKWEELQKAE